jgi:hypothetical protein
MNPVCLTMGVPVEVAAKPFQPTKNTAFAKPRGKLPKLAATVDVVRDWTQGCALYRIPTSRDFLAKCRVRERPHCGSCQ